MSDEQKPLELKHELAKLVRANAPVRWLQDAHTALEQIKAIDRVERQRFVASLDEHSGLDLRASDGFGVVGFAYCQARSDHRTLRFMAGHRWRENNPNVPQDCEIASEHDFICHVIQVLQVRFAI